MIDDDQLAFQRELVARGQRHHTIGGRNEHGTGGDGDIRAAMIAAGLALIDALRSEPAGLPPPDRPDEILPPAFAVHMPCARGDDPRQFGTAPRLERGAADPRHGKER